MGQSLNDMIYTGPDILSSLFGVFLRFCEGRIAMAADVKEMYHMLRLPDNDKPAMRFLWRTLRTKNQACISSREQCSEKCLRPPERTTL